MFPLIVCLTAYAFSLVYGTYKLGMHISRIEENKK